MSAKLLVNPGTPEAWEIQLKPGTNRIGRNEQNDFQIPHASISGTHCEIIVGGDGTILLRDLGSTNGTFLNRAPVTETPLQPGQQLQLGAVNLVLEGVTVAVALPADAPAPARARLHVAVPAPAPAAGAASPPLPPPVPARPLGLRLSGPQHAAAPVPAAAASATVAEELVDDAPPLPQVPLSAGAQFCKFHAKTPARFYCAKCQKFFCDLCVGTRASPAGAVHTCRACSSTVAPVQVNIERPSEASFFGQLPGSFIYPFKGTGVFILIIATVLIAGMDAISGGRVRPIGPRGFGFSLYLKIAVIGYLFLFLQNIIHATASGEKEMPGLPEFDGLFGAFLSLAGTVAISFGLTIALLAWAIFGEQEGLGPFITGTAILGCLYFPMAFLAVAMKDSVAAGNPLVVIPAILKVPGEYLVAALLMAVAVGLRQLGDIVMEATKMVGYTTRDMSVMFLSFGLRAVWSFMSIYLLVVVMRALGLLYVTKKHKFGWFSR